jgi:OmpA-OmpF porin, OOP family
MYLGNTVGARCDGESHLVGDDKTAEGRAENRRVVVRVLQNKTAAGL